MELSGERQQERHPFCRRGSWQTGHQRPGSAASCSNSGGSFFPDLDGRGMRILGAYRDLWKLHFKSMLPALPAMLLDIRAPQTLLLI